MDEAALHELAVDRRSSAPSPSPEADVELPAAKVVQRLYEKRRRPAWMTPISPR